MYRAPEIVNIISKEELVAKMEEESANVELYGCPSGGTYSNCMNA